MIEIRHEKMDKVSDIRLAYDHIYQAEGILHLDSLYVWLISLLGAGPGSSLVDVACGEGRLVTLARRRGIRATGIDFAYQGVRFGKKESPAASWLVGEGESLPFASRSFDFLTNVGSLEHFFSPAQGAAEMARILKPGGRACVLLPNAYGLLGNILNVARSGDVFDDGQPVQRVATRKTWIRLLESGGLQVEKVETYGEVMLRSRQDLAWLLRRPQKLVRLFVSLLIPANLRNNFVFICRVGSSQA